MLGLVTIILIALLIWGIWDRKDEDFYLPISILLTLSVIGCMIFGGYIANGRTLDNKIIMYTEENQKIEEQIGTLVKEYMNYESNTYIETKGESAISLVSLYPDLKADELVKQQISIHTQNNSIIKSLREKKLNIRNYKFWLYFGGRK